MKHSSYPIGLCVLTVCELWPSPAHAHLVSTRFGEYYSGLLHPLISLIHLVPWLALGLLAGLQRPLLARQTLLLFPFAVLVGTALTLVPVFNTSSQAPWLMLVNSLSFLVIGVLLVLAVKLRSSAYWALLIVLGLAHGLANGLVGDTLFTKGLFAAGVTTTAYVLVTLATTAGSKLQQQPHWGVIAMRASGSWVFAIGLLFIAFSFFGFDRAGV